MEFSCTFLVLTILGILLFRVNIDVVMLFLHEQSVIEWFWLFCPCLFTFSMKNRRKNKEKHMEYIGKKGQQLFSCQKFKIFAQLIFNTTDYV